MVNRYRPCRLILKEKGLNFEKDNKRYTNKRY